MKLAPPEQLQLLEHLANSLVGQQLLPERLGLAIGNFVNGMVLEGGAAAPAPAPAAVHVDL